MSYLTRNQPRKIAPKITQKSPPKSKINQLFTPQFHNWPYLLRRWLLKKDLSLCFTSTSRFLLFLLNFLSILHDFFVFIRSRLINKLMLAICVTQCCGEFFIYFLLPLVFRKITFPFRFPRFSFQRNLLNSNQVYRLLIFRQYRFLWPSTKESKCNSR